MLKDDIKILAYKGENVGLAASGIVNDLVVSNGRNPWDALLDLHETKLYYNLSENDLWTLHHAKLYGLYCKETGEAKSGTLRSWDYEDLDAVEFASKVFEVYRILTEKEVPPYILDAFFITKHVYAFLYELYENHEPMTVLTAVERCTNTLYGTASPMKGLNSRGSMKRLLWKGSSRRTALSL